MYETHADGESPEAGAPEVEEIDATVAETVLTALRRSSRRAFIMGEADGPSDVLLDRNFNFRAVGRLVRRELERLHLLKR
jgi:hypothetical protein